METIGSVFGVYGLDYGLDPSKAQPALGPQPSACKPANPIGQKSHRV